MWRFGSSQRNETLKGVVGVLFIIIIIINNNFSNPWQGYSP